MEVSVLSREVTNAEFQSYAKVRKGLKVSSDAAGAQRKSFLLKMPLQSAALIQIFSILYAWMLATCLHGVIYNLDYIGKPVDAILPAYNIISIPNSSAASALVAFLFLLPIMVVVIVPAIGYVKITKWKISRRPFAPQYMPHPGVSSVVVSVACHPLASEGDISREEIQWGVVEQARGDRPGRLAFTKNIPFPVIIGKKYFGANSHTAVKLS